MNVSSQIDTFIKEFNKKGFTNSRYENEKIILEKDSLSYEIYFPKEEIEEEMNNIIKVVGDSIIITNNKLQFMLISNNIIDEDLLLEVGYSGIIKKFKSNFEYPIIINNFHFLKLDNIVNEYHSLDDLITENMYLCEINVDSSVNKNKLSLIKDSIISDVLYSKSIYFKTFDELHSKKEVLSNKIIDVINTIQYKDNEPLKYFILAETIEYTNFKYLEYYHVIEYFFIIYSKKRIAEIMKSLITDTFVKNKKLDDDFLYDVYRNFLNPHRIKKNDFSEVEQLSVLFENINFDTLALALNNSNFKIENLCNDLFKLEGTKITLKECFRKEGGKTILNINCANDLKNDFLNQLSKRIYKIRNYLVHTKKGELKNDVFHPSHENLNILNQDVFLIREIARTLLIQSSVE